MILDSSMVEHSAVNRVVAGSSPARGVKTLCNSALNFIKFIVAFGKENLKAVWKAAAGESKLTRLHGQAVKTSPFHGGNTGSIPVGVICI